MVVCRTGVEIKRIVLVADGHGYLVTGKHSGGGDIAPGRLLPPSFTLHRFYPSLCPLSLALALALSRLIPPSSERWHPREAHLQVHRQREPSLG